MVDHLPACQRLGNLTSSAISHSSVSSYNRAFASATAASRCSRFGVGSCVVLSAAIAMPMRASIV